MEILIMAGKIGLSISAALTAGYGLLAIRFFFADRKEREVSTECHLGLCHACEDHFNCACHHHDRVIMKEMSR